MIRQYCQSCFKVVEFPDSAAGQTVPCTNCGKPFSVSAGYTPKVAQSGGLPPVAPLPSVQPQPTPPGKTGEKSMAEPDASTPQPASPTPAPQPATTSPPASTTPTPTPPAAPVIPAPPGLSPAAGGKPVQPSENTGSMTCTLNPVWLDWLPMACLVLAFVLTFFAWTHVQLSGYTVITQNGWESFSGSYGSNTAGKEWEDFERILEGKFEGKESARLRSDGMIIFYLLIFLFTLPLVIVERVLKQPEQSKLPGPLLWLPQVWKFVPIVLLGLSFLLFVLLAFQSLRGFGLQHSATAMATLTHQKALEAAETSTAQRAVWIEIGQTYGRFPATQTLWVNILFWLHLLAVLGYLARFWMKSRGNKPNPAITVRL